MILSQRIQKSQSQQSLYLMRFRIFFSIIMAEKQKSKHAIRFFYKLKLHEFTKIKLQTRAIKKNKK